MGRDTIRPVAMGFFAATNIYIMYQGTYQPPTQFSVFPPVIKNLLILNGLVFMAQIVPSTNAMLITWFGLWPLGEPPIIGQGQFWPWQLVTYGFLHGGFSHILFNMFALWMFGMQLENVWGSNRFTIFYFVCVVGAALVHLGVIWGGNIPTVGASGGVYGVLIAFAMMFPNQPIYLYFLAPVKAKWLVGALVVFELFNGVTGTQNGVAHFAHLGGAAFGALMLTYWRGQLPFLKPDRVLRY